MGIFHSLSEYTLRTNDIVVVNPTWEQKDAVMNSVSNVGSWNTQLSRAGLERNLCAYKTASVVLCHKYI